MNEDDKKKTVEKIPVNLDVEIVEEPESKTIKWLRIAEFVILGFMIVYVFFMGFNYRVKLDKILDTVQRIEKIHDSR